MDYVDRMAGRSASFDPNTLLKFTPLCARTLAWGGACRRSLAGAACVMKFLGMR